MALLPFPVSLTACVVFVLLLHKVLALIMLGSNIFGLPDYVIGEILSSSSGVLSKEQHRPIDGRRAPHNTQRSEEYERPEPPSRLLRIGKDAPGLTSMLTLDLTDKHLTSSCRRRKQSSSSTAANSGSESLVLLDSQLTFQKEFTLMNLGQTPVTVTGYLIGPHVGVSSSSYKSKSTLASLSDEPIGSNSLLSSLIGHLHCQGFGFRVLDCGIPSATDPSPDGNNSDTSSGNNNNNFEPFVLNPNASRKIGIAFTPDFTIAKSLATLTVVTDDGPTDEQLQKDWMTVLEEHFLPSAAALATGRKWLSILSPLSSSSPDGGNETSDMDVDGDGVLDSASPACASRPSDIGFDGLHLITYSLIATVPKNLLSVCERSLPRPYQEMILYYTLVVFMICLVTVTCAFAFIDGTRVLNFSFYPAVLMTRPPGPLDSAAIHSFKPFDLKSCEPPVVDASLVQQTSSEKPSSGWTSFFKNKLVSPRRGSTGSATSSMSGDSSGKAATCVTSASVASKAAAKKSGKKNAGRGSTTAEDAAVSSLRRRLNAQSWFNALSTRNREEQKDVVKIPLPTFEEVFDDQDIQNLKGQKGKNKGLNKNNENTGKKEKTETPPVSSSPSASSTGTSNASGSSSPTTTAAATSPVVTGPVTRDQTRTVLSSTPSAGIASFELPYNPGKGRRCESLSAVPSDASSVLFSHNGSYKESPSSDFGFWDPADNLTGTSSRSSVDNNMEIWDTVTMFDAQKAMLDLKKQKKQNQSRSQKQDSGPSKSSLCPFGPPVVDAVSNGSSFPAVGLFDPSLVHRQVNTPSPRGWSPSHKSLTASMSAPTSDRAAVNGQQRTTPSPIGMISPNMTTNGHTTMTWDVSEKDVLSRLRESSTDWFRGPTRVSNPVQRPAQSTIWPDVAPGGSRVVEKTNGFWPSQSLAPQQSMDQPPIGQSESSSWNPLSGGSNFSLFGRSLWSPIPPPPPGMQPMLHESPDSQVLRGVMWTPADPEVRK